MKNELIRQLQHRCWMSEEDYKTEGVCTDCGLANDFYVYKNNGANILGVAHLDTVQFGKHLFVHEAKASIVYSPYMDNRLGAFILLDFLPMHDINLDILLTTGEEMCMSTAQYFTPPEGKEYNWIAEFDRGGTDVVMYRYRDGTMINMLEGFGFDTGYGSYSDICELQDLGVKAFNFGQGMQNYHDEWGYVDLNDFDKMMSLFVSFYNTMQDVKLPHTKVTYRRYDRGKGHGRYSGAYGYDQYNYSVEDNYQKTASVYVSCKSCGTWTYKHKECNNCGSDKHMGTKKRASTYYSTKCYSCGHHAWSDLACQNCADIRHMENKPEEDSKVCIKCGSVISSDYTCPYCEWVAVGYSKDNKETAIITLPPSEIIPAKCPRCNLTIQYDTIEHDCYNMWGICGDCADEVTLTDLHKYAANTHADQKAKGE